MLNLLHPAALWTLAALTLPIAIHLWRPPPRTVRLGSLRFLETAPRHPLRNLRWRELLLLCARLSLLATLSLLLAEPFWIIALPPGPRRWALLDPTAAPAGESLGHWRELRSAGYEPHHLASGFPAVLNDPSPGTDTSGGAVPDLWSLLREADAELPVGSTLAVFSPTRLEELRGTRPALGHCAVKWFQTPDAAGDAAQEWVTSLSGRRVLAGRSDAHSTVFTIKPPDDPAASPSSLPATSILILHDAGHASDARYVEAAVRSAADASGHPVNVQNREITPDAENAAPTDWTLWLSTRPVPEGLAARARRMVRYAGGDPVEAVDRIVAAPGDMVDGVDLRKRALVPAQSPAGTVLWSDTQGHPVLVDIPLATGERLDLYTRFDPDWTDLPRTTALPAWMRALIVPESVALQDVIIAHDRRLADPTQSLQSDSPAAMQIPTLAPVVQPSENLRWPLVTLATLLFAAERILSLRRRPAASPVALSRSRHETVAVSR